MSYRGLVVPLPVGQQGFTGTENPSQAGPGHLLYTDGTELDANVIRKEGGASKFNATALGVDNFTKILLHFNGTDASTTITESSNFSRTWTANGNAQIDTADSKFGGASGLFDGTGDYVSTPDSADFALGSGDWSVDCWFKVNTVGGVQIVLAGQNDNIGSASSTSINIFRPTSNVILARVGIGSSFFSISGTTQFTNTVNVGWHHVAFVRTGNTIKLFIDGVQEGGDLSISGAINNSTNNFSVGRLGEHPGAGDWNGWIDEFRLSVGIARWTANFTPPASEYVVGGAGIGTPAAIISGINWSPSASALRDVVMLDGGVVLKDTGSGTFPVVMAVGLDSTRDPPPYFTVGGGETVGATRKLFLFNANSQVRIASGDVDTMSAITGPAADWSSAFPTFGVLHANRMFAGGNSNDPHRIYYTTTADHQNYSGGGTLAIYPGEGERIVGAVSFRNALAIFKYPAGIYIINTADPTPANWSVSRLTNAVGTLNQHTIVIIENDVLYMDASGSVHAISTTTEFGDFTSSDIGEPEKIRPFMRKTLNFPVIRRAVGIWHPKKQQMWLAVPMLGSVDNNMRFVTLIEPVAGSPEAAPTKRFFMSRRDIAISMWLRPDTNGILNPAIGDNAGFVWNMDTESRNKGGAGYPITFETANTDFGFADPSIATRMKAGQFLEIAYEPRGSWDLTAEVFWDDVLTDIIMFSMGSGGASLGSFILDTDTLASSNVRSQRIKMDGSGRRFRMVANNAGLNQDVSISGFYVHMTLMDERTAE